MTNFPSSFTVFSVDSVEMCINSDAYLVEGTQVKRLNPSRGGISFEYANRLLGLKPDALIKVLDNQGIEWELKLEKGFTVVRYKPFMGLMLNALTRHHSHFDKLVRIFGANGLPGFYFAALRGERIPLSSFLCEKLSSDIKPFRPLDRGYKHTERDVQVELAKKLKGRMEVSTPVGQIDVLTNSEIIEVKSVRGWKSGLGQLMAYGKYYPNHLKRLHLFGEVSLQKLRLIETCCNAHDVFITRDENLSHKGVKPND